MDIAYYTFGNQKTPKGELHDVKGTPLLEEGEVVIVQDNDAGCEVVRSGGLFPTMVFPDVGSGELFRTENRIMFFRIPPISDYAEGHHSWMDDRRKALAMAKAWLQKGHRESVVFSISEVIKTKRMRRGKEVLFTVSFNGQKYQIRITPSVRPFI